MATIRYLAEQALVTYLNSRTLTAEAVAGTASAVKDAPIIVCTAREWAEDELNLNWFRVRCTVETKGLATAGAAAFDTLCSAVRDSLRITDLGTELGAVESGVAFPTGGTGAPDKGDFSISDDIWIESRELELYCALTT